MTIILVCGDCRHYQPTTVAKRTGKCAHPGAPAITFLGAGRKTYRNSPICGPEFYAARLTHGDCKHWLPASDAGGTGRCNRTGAFALLRRKDPACDDGGFELPPKKGHLTRDEMMERGSYPCAGLKRDGTPCRSIAPRGHEYCRRHAGQRDGL